MQKRHHRQVKPSLARRLGEHKRILAATVLALALLTGGVLLHGHATTQQRIARALVLEGRGDRSGAAIELKNALQLAPNNEQARFLLGRIDYANSDFVNAEKELTRAIGGGAHVPEATILLARTLLWLRQPQVLLARVSPLPGEPGADNATILALRAQAQGQLGNGEAMAQSLRQADLLLADQPDTLAARATQAYAKGRPEEALSLVKKALIKEPKRADILVMQGDFLRALKQPDAAMVAYGRAIAFEPGNLPARLGSVQLYLEKSELDQAQAQLRALQTLAPNNLMARYLDGLIEFRRKHYDVAYARLQDVLRSAPDFAPANFLVGAISLGQGKSEYAISVLNHVLEVAPTHLLARKLLASALLETGQVERAQQLIANIKDDRSDAQLLALQGGIALRRGAYQAAREKLEQAVALVPNDQKLIRELAASRMASGDEAGAIVSLDRLATLDTTTHQADALLVATLVQERRYDDALQAIANLDRRYPDLALASNLRGVVLAARNQAAQARLSFTRALLLDPGYFAAARNLARLDLADKNFQAARGRYQMVLKQNPNNSHAWTALAELAAMEKKEAEFVALLERAKKANPTDADPRQLLARHWLARNESGKALIEARAAVAATGRPELLDLVAAAQLQQNDLVGARLSFEQWIQARPNNPYAHYRLAQALSLAKADQAALASLNRALALRPAFTQASLDKARLLARTGQVAAGIKIARTLQSHPSSQAAALLAEADIQYSAEKYEEAAKLYLKSAPAYGRAMARVYQAYAAAGKGAEGERQLELWLATHPEDRAIRHILAQAQLDGGQYQKAAANYRRLIRANPRDLVAYNNLAWVLGEQKDPQALAVAGQAYRLEPGNTDVLDTYAWQLDQSGQSALSLPLLRVALKNRPGDGEIRWHLSTALAHAGRKQEASVELDRLLASPAAFPQRAQARTLLAQLRGSR